MPNKQNAPGDNPRTPNPKLKIKEGLLGKKPKGTS
jgi:hypothetical protein